VMTGMYGSNRASARARARATMATVLQCSSSQLVAYILLLFILGLIVAISNCLPSTECHGAQPVFYERNREVASLQLKSHQL
jgi:hypothetical protein